MNDQKKKEVNILPSFLKQRRKVMGKVNVEGSHCWQFSSITIENQGRSPLSGEYLHFGAPTKTPDSRTHIYYSKVTGMQNSFLSNLCFLLNEKYFSVIFILY